MEKNEMNVNEVEMDFALTDQAATVVAGLQNVATEIATEYEQVFVASTGIDEMEKNLKAATKKYMHENGFSSCPISLAGMELMSNPKADTIPRLIAQRIKAICDCHKVKGSYVIVTSDLEQYAVQERKTGNRDWLKEVGKALSTISKNTVGHYPKEGDFVKPSNPVEYNIENKLKKSGRLLIHFQS